MERRRVKTLTVVAVLVLLAYSAACAKDGDVTVTVRHRPSFDTCLDKAGGVTADMLDCIGAENAYWDGRLNAAYGAIMRSPNWSAATKAKVRDAQQAWLAYRTSKCAAEGDLAAEGGTLALVVSAGCELEATAQRASELEAELGTASPR
jgi:uncharacterized protein YecT (DUF1311 family)